MPKIITRKTCRLCGSDKLKKVLNLGNLYVSTFVSKKSPSTPLGTGESGGRAPLELVLCENKKCQLLQLRHTAPQEFMYTRHYWYRSGLNQVIIDDLKDIAKKSQKLVSAQGGSASGGKKGDVILDIGANDGTLLDFYPKKYIRVGCEPANNLQKELRKRADYIIHEFWSAEAYKKLGLPKAKIVTAIGMFYDMEDPNQFVRDAERVMADDGIFVAQLMTLKPMIEKNDLGNICVKPDTLILGDNQRIKDVTTGTYAIGRSNQLVEVLAKMERPYTGDLIQIKPTYLEPITLTPEHPLLVVKKEYLRLNCGQLKPVPDTYAPEWVPAKQVKRGDWVVMPRLQENKLPAELDLRNFNQINSRWYRGGLEQLPLDSETAWLLGLYVAEGHVGGQRDNPYLNFTLHEREKNIVERLDKIFRSLGYKTTRLTRAGIKSVEVRTVCAALCRACIEWFGKGAINKRIPDFLLFAPAEIKIAFLRGLFEGDGYVRGNKVHFHTSSKTLAMQVQLMVASLGGILGISYVKPYEREIRGGKVVSKDSWQLRGSSKNLAKIFNYMHRGPEIPHALIKEDYILVPIKRVSKEFYSGTVYNIETEDNSYLVSNAVVHNCHEHLEFYSYPSLKYLFEKNGLEIFKVEENSINGGSYRLYAQKFRRGSINYPEPRFDYKAFAKRLEESKKKTVGFIKKAVREGKKVYGYGASTKGNTILQYFGLNPELVKAISDKSKEKWGRYTVGTMIPIISENQARKDKPDYFLILPWAFTDAFVKREKGFLRRGGKFIVPFPKFRIISEKT